MTEKSAIDVAVISTHQTFVISRIRSVSIVKK